MTKKKAQHGEDGYKIGGMSCLKMCRDPKTGKLKLSIDGKCDPGEILEMARLSTVEGLDFGPVLREAEKRRKEDE